ncbi:acyl-CoA thioesterase [Rhizorhabdus wittichii]|uniref:Acyl-CoA thioesterase n=1 Tax=Rhizorhabdus wittichii TaxID=160791 RepID=A0A975CZC2_9SPHN|nr:thioesterase family protein [Rhizorhabdus wittichii]QTH20087.1 acyl-CoA thioesterase [Rhizorhabdus wittichii]
MTDHAVIDCGFAVAHPWLCDAMGHLSTRHYLGMFDDASYQVFATLGYDPVAAAAEGWGWADVRHEIDYRHEVRPGAVLRITGRISALGRSSIAARFALIDRAGDRLCAELEARTVCFDLRARRARPVPPAIAARVGQLFGLAPPA